MQLRWCLQAKLTSCRIQEHWLHKDLLHMQLNRQLKRKWLSS